MTVARHVSLCPRIYLRDIYDCMENGDNMKKKTKLIIIISALAVGAALLILWRIGMIGLWTDGICYVVENTDKTGTARSHVIKGTYSLPIDLKNLKSNAGKDLYRNGKYRIYVDSVYKDDSSYKIDFKSCGTYSLTNATLISVMSDNTSDMYAKITAEYNGKSYHSKVSGYGPMNHDGDSFGFYIFGGEPVTLHKNAIVKLTVTDLYENIWNR